MRAEIEDFERAFVARAGAASPSRVDGILLGRESDLPQTDGRFVAGWWCRPGTDPRVTVLPNPWDDRPAIALYDQHSWQLTQALLVHLARTLDELHDVARPLVYWDLLLVQWLQGTVTAALDRLLFIDAARALAPDAPFLSAPATLRTPDTLAVASDDQLHDPWNVAFLRTVCERSGFALRDLPETPPPARRPASTLTVGHCIAALDAAPRVLSQRLVARRLGSPEGRRIALLGATSFSPLQLLALARDVPGLRVAPRSRDVLTLDASQPLCPGRDRLHINLTGAKRLGDLLPTLVPRSVLEDHSDLVRRSERRCGPPCNLVHRNYAWDDVENEFLARSAAAGKTLAFAQHGGATFQLAVAPTERHMHREGRRYISWAASVEGNVRPAADPYVQTLRDTHRGGSSILLVEWMTPPYSYVYRFTSTPMANQAFTEEMRLVRFVQAAGAVRARLLLKGFPGLAAAAHRHPALRALPMAERWRRRPAPYWMRHARLAVVAYPDTPFIEAMVIGVPTIGLWDPHLWGMRDDVAPHFERLQELGVVHSDPERCAAKVGEVYGSADAWWSTPEIASARAAFLARFAVAGDWRAEWAAALRELLPEAPVAESRPGPNSRLELPSAARAGDAARSSPSSAEPVHDPTRSDSAEPSRSDPS